MQEKNKSQEIISVDEREKIAGVLYEAALGNSKSNEEERNNLRTFIGAASAIYLAFTLAYFSQDDNVKNISECNRIILFCSFLFASLSLFFGVLSAIRLTWHYKREEQENLSDMERVTKKDFTIKEKMDLQERINTYNEKPRSSGEILEILQIISFLAGIILSIIFVSLSLFVR